MSDLITDKTALNAVRAFLGPDESDSSKSDEEPAPVIRPARLGLGAKWVGQGKPGGGAQGIAAVGTRRLAASLRVEGTYKLQDDNGDEGSADSCDGDDSRAHLTAKRVRKRIRVRRQPKLITRQPKPDAKKIDSTLVASANVSEFGNHQSKKESDGKLLRQESQPSLSNDVLVQLQPLISNSSAQQTVHALPQREQNINNKNTSTPLKRQPQWHRSVQDTVPKKRKVRSRQKNLKKDLRPKDKLPPHLTETTLRRGRIQCPSVSKTTTSHADHNQHKN